MNGIGVWHQLVEHLRAVCQRLIVFAVLVEQSYRLSVASLGIAEFLSRPVEVTQFQQQHTFFYSCPCGFCVTLLIGLYGLCGIIVKQVDITHSVIHLVEIVLVVVRGSHSLQLAYHLFSLAAGHHLGHRYASVEVEFVWRVQSQHSFECLVSEFVVSQFCLQLSHEIPFACLLLASHLMAYHLAQIRYCLLYLVGVDVIVGIGVVPLFHGAPVKRVTSHLCYHVLGVVHEVRLDVALCQPCSCFSVDGGLRGIEPAHV